MKKKVSVGRDVRDLCSANSAFVMYLAQSREYASKSYQ